MNSHIKKLIDKAAKHLSNPQGIADMPEAYIKDIKIQIGGLLQKDLRAIIDSLGGNCCPKQTLKPLNKKCLQLILKELRVKEVRGGYSVLQDSPLRLYLQSEEVTTMSKTTTEEPTTEKKSKRKGRVVDMSVKYKANAAVPDEKLAAFSFVHKTVSKCRAKAGMGRQALTDKIKQKFVPPRKATVIDDKYANTIITDAVRKGVIIKQ